MSIMIGVRVGKNEKRWLAEVAALKGMTLSGFLRDAARIEAHRVLGPPTPVELRSNPEQRVLPEG